MEEVVNMQAMSTELPEPVAIKIAKKLIENRLEKGFIWIKKIKENHILVSIEDGFGNMNDRVIKYTREGYYTLEESYVIQLGNKKLFVGYDDDIICEVNTIWRNNKNNVTNPLINLREKYINSGGYTGDIKWLKRLDKLEKLGKELEAKNEIKKCSRTAYEVTITYDKILVIFGVNYAVITNKSDKSCKEFFELVSHKDTIIGVKSKLQKSTHETLIKLVNCYDLR